MIELLNWLSEQKGSLRTYLEFQNRALALRALEPENAALLRLLADLAGRFAEAFDGQPLSVAVAESARERILRAMRQAVTDRSVPPSERLALLNEIAAIELV